MYVMLDFGRNVHGNGGIWQISKIAFRTLWTLEHINVYRENMTKYGQHLED